MAMQARGGMRGNRHCRGGVSSTRPRNEWAGTRPVRSPIDSSHMAASRSWPQVCAVQRCKRAPKLKCAPSLPPSLQRRSRHCARLLQRCRGEPTTLSRRHLQQNFARGAALLQRVVRVPCAAQRQSETDFRLHFAHFHERKQLCTESSNAARSFCVDVVESGCRMNDVGWKGQRTLLQHSANSI